MIPAADDDHFLRRPVELQQELPVENGRRWRVPNGLTEEFANRTVVVAQMQCRATCNRGLAMHLNRSRRPGCKLFCIVRRGGRMIRRIAYTIGVIAAIVITSVIVIVATCIVPMPLTRQQMQPFPSRGKNAKKNGENPSEPDSPIRPHNDGPLEKYRNRSIALYVMVVIVVLVCKIVLHAFESP